MEHHPLLQRKLRPIEPHLASARSRLSTKEAVAQQRGRAAWPPFLFSAIQGSRERMVDWPCYALSPHVRKTWWSDRGGGVVFRVRAASCGATSSPSQWAAASRRRGESGRARGAYIELARAGRRTDERGGPRTARAERSGCEQRGGLLRFRHQ